jgi:hypothetical protein
MRRLTRVPLQYLLGSAGFRRARPGRRAGRLHPPPGDRAGGRGGRARAARADAGGGGGPVCRKRGHRAGGSHRGAGGAGLCGGALRAGPGVDAPQRGCAGTGPGCCRVHGADRRLRRDPSCRSARTRWPGSPARWTSCCRTRRTYPMPWSRGSRRCATTSPSKALFGGADGLDLVRGITRTALLLLRPGGLLGHRARRRPGTGRSRARGSGPARWPAPGRRGAGRSGHGRGIRAGPRSRDRIDLNSRPRFTMARRAGPRP